MRNKIVTLLLAALAVVLLLVVPAAGTTTTVVDDVVTTDPGDPAPPETSEEGPTSAAVLGALITFGLIVKMGVAVVKKAAPAVQGLGTIGVATALGVLVSGAFDFQAAAALAEKYELTGVVNRVPDGAFGWLISGIAIAAASGFFAEVAGTSGPNSLPSSVTVNLEEPRKFDEGYNPGDPGYDPTNL